MKRRVVCGIWENGRQCAFTENLLTSVDSVCASACLLFGRMKIISSQHLLFKQICRSR